MKATCNILRCRVPTGNKNIIKTMLESLPSLEYHKNYSIIKTFCEILFYEFPKWDVSNEIHQLVEGKFHFKSTNTIR